MPSNERSNDRPNDPEPAVAFRDVVKRYGAVVALDRASFQVGRGETVALLGPNGAGKSTAIDILLGLRRADAGQARVLGDEPGRAVAAGRVGAMLQTAGLPEGARVGELVELARRLYAGARRGPEPRGRAELLDLAGITELARRPLDRLSGGQAQRVRFALALAGRPELLFLDEPTVALDVESRRRFWAGVQAVAAEGTSVVFATHYLDEADAHADRVVVLHRGRVVADGPPASVKATTSVRTIRAVLAEPDPAWLLTLPGVQQVSVHGRGVTLRSADADATVGAMYARGLAVRDLEVTGAGLEEALLALTDDRAATSGTPTRTDDRAATSDAPTRTDDRAATSDAPAA
jgi:ABC-2 type transport system ATP-binding protein